MASILDWFFKKPTPNLEVETPSWIGSLFNYAVSGFLLGMFIDLFLVFSDVATNQPTKDTLFGLIPWNLMWVFMVIGALYSFATWVFHGKEQKNFLEEWKLHALKAPKAAIGIFLSLFLPITIAMVLIFYSDILSKGAGAIAILMASFLFRFLLNEIVCEARSITTGKKKIVWAIPLVAIAYVIVRQWVQTL